jgi:IS1 family transposase
LSETLVKPDATKSEESILELDERWSCVQTKARQAWVWIALCRKTRQIAAYAIGDRSEDTCRELWNRIPGDDQKGHCSTDFWRAYQAVIPEEQHSAVGKETGETAHVERWNTMLRQRVGRFVRKTLSFSQASFMHEACLRLFLHRSHLEQAIILQ